MYNIGDPLLNVDITDRKLNMLFMRKLTMSTGPFSIAMLNYQWVRYRVYPG